MSTYYHQAGGRHSQNNNQWRSKAFTTFDSERRRDYSQQRQTPIDDITQLKYEEIRKKYGSRQKRGVESYESEALKEISLRHSNYNSINSISASKNSRFQSSIQKKYESKSSNYAAHSPYSKPPNHKDYCIPVSPFLKQQQNLSPINIGIKPISIQSNFKNSIASPIPSSFSPSVSYRPRNTRLDTSTICRSIEKYVPDSANKQRQRERVGSIDKINMKIHQILNCLNQNAQKRDVPKYQQEKTKIEEIKDLKKFSHIQQPKISQTKRQSLKQPLSSIQKPYVSSFVWDKQTPKLQALKQNIYQRVEISSEDRSRRYSMLTSSYHNPSKLKSSSVKPQQSRRSNSILKDRDIDEQIRRIQQRIKNTEEKKKKLNISGQKWSQKQNQNSTSIPKRVAIHSKGTERSSILLERKNRLYNNSVFKLTEGQGYTEKVPAIKVTQPQQNIQQASIPVEISEVNIPASKRVSFQQNSATSRVLQSNRGGGLKNLSINNIKSSILYNQDPAPSCLRKPQTKRLIEALKDQVSRDQYLRNAKVLLSYNQKPNKNQMIQQILVRNGIELNEQEFKREIQTTLQQHNPFFSVRQSTQSIEQLVSKYVQSYNHWNEKVKGKFNEQELTKEGFNEQKMDLQKKGSLSLQDLVRFMNIETGNFYRNRDLILLFRRVSSNGSLNFQQLLEVICQK